MTTLPPAGPSSRTVPVLSIVAINAGVSDPSSTRLLADRLSAAVLEDMTHAGRPATAAVIDLAPLAEDVVKAVVAGFPSRRLEHAIATVASADVLVAATPVYKAGVSGLFKSFVDVLDDDLLVAKPIILAATGGTPRHALVAEHQMRDLFAYFRTLTAPTAVYASAEDWADPSLSRRIRRAATEARVLALGALAGTLGREAGYERTFAGQASGPSGTDGDVDFDTDLMRLATGGGHRAPSSRPDPTPAPVALGMR